jgi:molybdopterin molybdotransferase
MLSFDAALERVLSLAPRLGAERIDAASADGRVLAEPILGKALPPFDHSAMDGYAIRLRDLPEPAGGASGMWSMPLVGESAAGAAPIEHASGSACRVSTGAPMPRGADTVIMQEDVERVDETAPSIRSEFRPREGAWVRRRGADLAEGELAIARGTRLGPGSIALAAALDRAWLEVARRPVVTILASGDELRSPGDPPRPGSIAESNGWFVASAARRVGAIARLGPFVRDDRASAIDAVRAALDGSDMVVTIGGVSVGDHDVMRPALEAAGVELAFHRVAMKPGKPIAVGTRGSCVVLGLPGNPASASLTFLLFGIPLLRAMQSESAVLASRARMRIVGEHARSAGRTEFLRARTEVVDGTPCAALDSNQASGAVTSFARAELLVVVPAAQGDVRTGDELETIRIAELLGN